MSIYLMVGIFIIGLILIIFGSDWFVDATIWVAKVLKIPNFIIGATLVSLCTTLPEMFVSTSSALRGNTDMAFGNATGSVACNTALILGTVIVFSTPSLLHKKALSIKSTFIPIALIACYIVGSLTGYITSYLGIVLLSLTVVYVLFNLSQAKKHKNKLVIEEEAVETDKKTVYKNILLFAVGLAFTIIGANLMVVYGEKIALALNVPSIVIGVTMTALGTSLPELVTSITAIRKKVTALSIGNIFGANVLNMTLVLGTASIIKPVEFLNEIKVFHLPIIIAITLIAAAGTLFSKKKYPRFLGIILLCSYVGYIATTIITL